MNPFIPIEAQQQNQSQEETSLNPFIPIEAQQQNQSQEETSLNPFIPIEAQHIDDAQLSSQSGDQSYDGLCEEWAEQNTYGKTGLFPSAIAAWNNYADQGNAYQGTQGIQPGDLIYFAPDSSNSDYGHVGIYNGNNQFTSATYNGVQTNDLNTWTKDTGQQVLGFVQPQGGNYGSN